MNRKTLTGAGSAIEVSAHYEHSVTITTKLTADEAITLGSTLEGVLAFLLQSKEPLNPNAASFLDNGLAVLLDFAQGVINACDQGDEADERTVYTVDEYVDRWERHNGGPRKLTKKQRSKKQKRA